MNYQNHSLSRPTAIIILVVIVLIIIVGSYFLWHGKGNINSTLTNTSNSSLNANSTSEMSLTQPLVAYLNDGNVWIANMKGENKQLTSDNKATALFGWSKDNQKVIYGVDSYDNQENYDFVIKRNIAINKVDIDSKNINKVADEKGLAGVYYLPKLDKYILQDSNFTFWLADYNKNSKEKIDEVANPLYDGGPSYSLLISNQEDKIIYWQAVAKQLRLYNTISQKIDALITAKGNSYSYSPLGWGKDEKTIFFSEFKETESNGSYILNMLNKKTTPLFNQNFFSLGYIHYNSLTNTYVLNGNLKSTQYSIVPPVYLSPSDLQSYKEIIGTSEDVLWINGTKNLSYLEPIDPLSSYRIWLTDEYGKNHLLIADNLRYSTFHYLPVWTN